MREIKFRGWDTRKNKMTRRFILATDGTPFYDDGNTDDGGLAIKNVSGHWDEEDNWLAGLEIMQFTGLLDSKGKEIYEGDIVHHGRNAISEVIFTEGAFLIAKVPIYFKRPDELKVIGNIYESPELLS